MQYIKYVTILALFIAGCTAPGNGALNEKAGIQAADELPENPLLLIPLTFSIHPKEGSMSTLYGNNKALQHAKLNGDSAYPAGSVLYEVTWKQKADVVWYGANVPDQIKQVERVVFNAAALPGYELYSGHPLRKVAVPSSAQRIASITGQRMAVNP